MKKKKKEGRNPNACPTPKLFVTTSINHYSISHNAMSLLGFNKTIISQSKSDAMLGLFSANVAFRSPF